jgi:protein SCO1
MGRVCAWARQDRQTARSGGAKGLLGSILAGLALLLLVGPVLAQSAEADTSGLFFDEQLGQILPGDIVLRDEGGLARPLSEWIDKPTILSLVYFDCPGICTPLLNEVTDVLGKTDLDPRITPFQLLTVSFEPRDTPAMAAEKRQNYLRQLSRPFPPESWRFLTGEAGDLQRLQEAVGFRAKKVGFDYIHPGGLILLTPERKVSRYLYGIQFLPFDFKMGVIEAARGEVRPTTARLLRFCFSYDPEGRTYVFNTMRVVGSTMLLTLGLFGGFLAISTQRRRQRQGD